LNDKILYQGNTIAMVSFGWADAQL